MLLIAKSKEIARATTTLFKENKIKKVYWAIVIGIPEKNQGIIRYSLNKSYDSRLEKMIVDPNNKKYAETKYKVIEKKNNLSLLELYPKTGRTHQIRAHLLAINTPILGDKKYKNKNVDLSKFPYSTKLKLHAKELKFTLNNKKFSFHAQLPEDFVEILKINNFRYQYE